LETARVLSAPQQALSKTLDRMVALWKEGQARSAWMGMRSAVVDHLRQSLGLGPGPLPSAALKRSLRPLDAPELAQALELLASDQVPRGAFAEVTAARLLRLAQVLDALDPNQLHGGTLSKREATDLGGGPSGPDSEGEA
jgi:hypothetical protein